MPSLYLFFFVSAERLRMQYTGQTQLNIFNNTVINTFPRGSPPPSKREISQIFSVDCFGAQGDHNPFWNTNNPLLGDENGIAGYQSIVLSNYSARVQLLDVTPDLNGTFSCVSNRSGLFSQFFLTAGELSILYYIYSLLLTVHISDVQPHGCCLVIFFPLCYSLFIREPLCEACVTSSCYSAGRRSCKT